jgi:hypothetical protein
VIQPARWQVWFGLGEQIWHSASDSDRSAEVFPGKAKERNSQNHPREEDAVVDQGPLPAT